MDRKPFDAPVTVFLGNSRQFRAVADVTEASDFLFDHWSENDSAPWLSAMNQCRAAMMGRLGPGVVGIHRSGEGSRNADQLRNLAALNEHQMA
jgi:hypothetical protein